MNRKLAGPEPGRTDFGTSVRGPIDQTQSSIPRHSDEDELAGNSSRLQPFSDIVRLRVRAADHAERATTAGPNYANTDGEAA